MREGSETISEIHDLLGKIMPFREGIRRVNELEARYNVKIIYVEHIPLTAGPDDKELIISDYKRR